MSFYPSPEDNIPILSDDPNWKPTDNIKPGRRGTWVYKADSPLGPFEPVSDGSLTPRNWMALDGTLLVDEGKPYMVFCHEWTQVRNGEICSIQLSDDLTKAVTEPNLLFKAADFACVKSIDMDDGFVTDGPFLYRDGEELYMIWSS